MITIRQLQPEHRERLARLIEERGIFPKYEIGVALEVIDDALRFPERGDYRVFCAFEAADRLAGYICFGRIPLTDACYDLYWIVVDERYSGKGIGRALIDHMERLARMQGARRIYIETSSLPVFAPARSFYKKHQYEVVSVLTDFYRRGDHKMVFMKDLESAVALE